MIVRTAHLPINNGEYLQSGGITFARYRRVTEAYQTTAFLHTNCLIYVLDGYKQLHFSNETVTVDKDKLLLIKSGLYLMSGFIPEGLDYQAVIIYCSDDVVRKFCLKYFPAQERTSNKASSYLTIQTNELLDSFRDQYLSYFNKAFPNLEAILQVKLYELLLLLLSGENKEEVKTWLQAIAFEQPVELDHVVKKHLFHQLTLEEFAKLSGRSLASFKRDFQNHYHTSPKKWIHQQRLIHARMLLQTGNQNVSEVAYACGFENIPYFTRSFKKEFGVTPSQVRVKVQ
ncbi:AraC-type DNA-binding protein [Chryseolinea serpens]|uniref:AraC-type DNA-binding protein n=1 Tax=Chryseolinea serpens TaxID=947013 RepID=A0A1M5MPT1_9BACT|nr:AraC family transcriptional regulator [Chryseolinea serpens]SHG79246.1 AraC-type DNA-binding protein [Chryseolinea serpens]